ncbi:MAG TPA: hypothetical protein VK457_05245, partial [Chloroflexota bacterium]|nr:hypothetical protein [Chloroflexota bacterium]
MKPTFTEPTAAADAAAEPLLGDPLAEGGGDFPTATAPLLAGADPADAAPPQAAATTENVVKTAAARAARLSVILLLVPGTRRCYRGWDLNTSYGFRGPS